jgi:hypothetical protein
MSRYYGASGKGASVRKHEQKRREAEARNVRNITEIAANELEVGSELRSAAQGEGSFDSEVIKMMHQLFGQDVTLAKLEFSTTQALRFLIEILGERDFWEHR